eukprot:9143424-Pyramimonas_sp.AAC.1
MSAVSSVQVSAECCSCLMCINGGMHTLVLRLLLIRARLLSSRHQNTLAMAVVVAMRSERK